MNIQRFWYVLTTVQLMGGDGQSKRTLGGSKVTEGSRILSSFHTLLS